MNRGHGNWLYENLDSCCQRYYGWDEVGCRLRNAEATLVSGTISSTVDPTDNLYFPDWERTDTCINDGTAPPYMKKQASLWMYEGLTDCCQAYYGWEAGFVSCTSSQGGDPPTRSPITESWCKLIFTMLVVPLQPHAHSIPPLFLDVLLYCRC